MHTHDVSTAESVRSSSRTPLFSLERLCLDEEVERDVEEPGDDRDAYELEAHLDDRDDDEKDEPPDNVEEEEDDREVVGVHVDVVLADDSGVDMLLLSDFT